MSGAMVRRQESGDATGVRRAPEPDPEPGQGWTRAELLAVVALLAVLLTGTGWVIWDRYSLRAAYGEAGAAAGAAAQAGAAGKGGMAGEPGAARESGAGGEVGTAGHGGAAGEQGAEPQREPKGLFVHVAGAVRAPGVYRLQDGARVVDAVEAAGGASANGRPDVLNLAAPLADGDRIYIPTLSEVTAGGAGASQQPGAGQGGPGGWTGSGSAKVDVNHADAGALESLPGVGPSLAAAILAYRREHGPFRTLNDLEKVPGIGPAKLAALRDRIVLR